MDENLAFTVHFTRMINDILMQMIEILYEARDRRDTNDIYGQIFGNISDLHRHMSFYVRTVTRGEKLDRRQRYAPKRSENSRGQ